MTARRLKVYAYLPPEDYQKLEHMSVDDKLDRSIFIRKLIRNEWIRRYSKPNPAISVAEAKAAGAAIAGAALETAQDAHDPSVAETEDIQGNRV